MGDTAVKLERLIAERYASLSVDERVRLCTRMFDFARALIESSLPAGLDDYERRRRIVERLYGAALANDILPPTGFGSALSRHDGHASPQ